MYEITSDKPRFLDEPLRCQVIAVTPRRDLLDLDEPGLDATPDVGIDEADCDPKLT
jgi:hypothetical protein